MQTVALIVAAGRGERFGAALPKQYACLGGIAVLRRSILAFVDHPGVDAVRVVIGAADAKLYVLSAGLGLIPSDRQIPLYGLTVARGYSESIAARVKGDSP